MKYFKLSKTVLLAAVITVLAGSCKKESLQIINPNEPTTASLTSEAGVKAFALGMYIKGFGGNDFTTAIGNHEIMGDELFVPWGNYGWRWVSQVNKITLQNNTVINNPIGPRQVDQLKSTNSRVAGELNSFQYEWRAMYLLIGQCNTLLQSLENPALQLVGDAAAKKAFFKGWALWWKGYAYSRIGSMYLAGIINNEVGITNPEFVANAKVIEEANRVLDLAATEFSGITAGDTHTELFKAVVPDFCDNNKVVTPDMMKRHINTLKARNFVVNKKTKSMTAADWTAALALANNGLQQGDFPLVYGCTSDGNNALNWLAVQPWFPIFLNYDGWWFTSPRHAQEYKTGDARFDKNFIDYGTPFLLNPRGRGIQYGTSVDFNYIEDGGSFASANKGLGKVPLSGTYEENELMKAEAKIRSGQIAAGLAHVDAVRTFQNSTLSAVSGVVTTAPEAIEEMRKERRVALFLRGMAFYDARRWGITEPASAGGGRAGAMVWVPSGATYLGLAAPALRPCFMDYDYMDYWDIPQNELDFNEPSSTSAPVKN
jgi:starch-binding outer membrane protein, SusD/RagB family